MTPTKNGGIIGTSKASGLSRENILPRLPTLDFVKGAPNRFLMISGI
jgi:hypothetical protein